MGKKIGIGFVALLIIAFSYFIVNFGPIISGFGAKAVCSCVYVSNRTAQSAIDNELAAFPLSLGDFFVTPEDKSATGSVFGFAEAKAIYREGLGCTLIREISEIDIRNQIPDLKLTKPVLSNTVYWPFGTKLVDTIPSNVNMEKLQLVISKAFEDSNPKIPANTRGIVVIYKGQLITEKYAKGFDKNMPQLGWSMTKSVTNMLYGILDIKEEINIMEPTLISSWQNDDRAKITTDQLLRMSSGLYWEEVYSNVSTATNMLYKFSDMGGFAQSQMVEFAPEQKWYYSSGSTNILSLMLRKKLGDENYYEFAQNELFSKIGITTAVIEPDASGTFVGSSYMWASARDWARLGLLYLNKGNWYGNQIMTEDWVNYSVTPTPKAPKGEYGSQWWLNAGEPGNPSNRLLPNVPTDMYMMDGYEGQRVFVVPSSDLVVVRLGQNKKGGFDHDAFLSGIISCVN
ncbi:MAG: serine hydrolase domain-containing protein [Salibacteraceae bacterium]